MFWASQAVRRATPAAVQATSVGPSMKAMSSWASASAVARTGAASWLSWMVTWGWGRELDALRGDPDEVRAGLSEHIPLRRYGEPEEFGRTAAFVLSPAAAYITGAMIPVDGGAISSI
jgi:3-oxoacyl-[acyl-carrier protein] reductase